MLLSPSPTHTTTTKKKVKVFEVSCNTIVRFKNTRRPPVCHVLWFIRFSTNFDAILRLVPLISPPEKKKQSSPSRVSPLQRTTYNQETLCVPSVVFFISVGIQTADFRWFCKLSTVLYDFSHSGTGHSNTSESFFC